MCDIINLKRDIGFKLFFVSPENEELSQKLRKDSKWD